MKKYYLPLISLIIVCMSLVSCKNNLDFGEDNRESDLKNEYTKVWIKTFGLIDPKQNWCTVSQVSASINMPEGVKTVSIYNGDPAEGAHLIGQTSSNGSLLLDLPTGAESVYARLTDTNGKLMSRGYYPIVDGRTKIDGSVSNAQRSRAEGDIKYAHTPSYFDAMIICEDLGSIGDFDFNDIVIGLKHVSGEDAKLTIVPMAAGGTLASEIYFDGKLVGEIHNLISEGSPTTTMLNTNTSSIGSVSRLNYVEIPLTDTKYSKWTIAKNWGDITIRVINKDNTVLINKPTEGGAPQLICLGGDWFWPKETKSIKSAYTGFENWSCEAKATTWLGDWEEGLIVKWDVPTDNPDDPDDPEDPENLEDPYKDKMWFCATTTGNVPYTVHLNGSTTTQECSSGVKYIVETPFTSCENMFAVYSTTQALILHSDGNYLLGYPTVDNYITQIEFSENFDMSAVTTFAHMFDGCRSLTSVNVDAWTVPTGGVLTDLTAMFHYCEKLTSLNLSDWDVSNVTQYFDIFGYCTSLSTLNLDGWEIKDGANLRRFLGDTSGVTVKCSSTVEAKLKADETLGGTGTTYTRP